MVTFASRAAEKVRRDNLVAGALQVFLQTDRFRHEEPQYSNAATLKLAPATANTPDIIGATTRGLDAIWRDGFNIRKAGVILLDLVDPTSIPRDLFSGPAPTRPKALMAALDGINGRYGRGAAVRAGRKGSALADEAGCQEPELHNKLGGASGRQSVTLMENRTIVIGNRSMTERYVMLQFVCLTGNLQSGL